MPGVHNSLDRYVSKPRFLNEGQAERWADKMIKEPKFIRETQGVFGRRVYIIRPKKELIDHILEIDPACKDDSDYFSSATVSTYYLGGMSYAC